jgi:hypothetical protein
MRKSFIPALLTAASLESGESLYSPLMDSGQVKNPHLTVLELQAGRITATAGNRAQWVIYVMMEMLMAEAPRLR